MNKRKAALQRRSLLKSPDPQERNGGDHSGGVPVPNTVVVMDGDDDFELSFESGLPVDEQGFQVLSPPAFEKEESGSVCLMNPETGRWTCRPYKREKLKDEMDQAQATGRSKKVAILETLLKMHITCYVVEHGSENILKDLRSIVDKVAHENRNIALFNPNVTQRCCLFEDHEGRLFNLVFSNHAVGPAGQWESLLSSFSGTEAMIAFTVLCRSLPCAFEDNIGQLRPAYLSLILGLVFSEEISLSWLNTGMLVRSMPSVSAHTMTSTVGSDWLRKILTLVLALAGAATGDVQKYMTISGICLTGAVLMANLGSRAWFFMKWRPFWYSGPFSQLLGYLAAIIAGLIFPYMGHREIEAGGKRALESVLTSAVVVAIVFVLSDFDEIQKLLVVGSEACPQDDVNIVVGIWWTITLLSSMLMVLRIEPYQQFPADEESLLVPSQASPVGFRVPNLPDFVVDPNLVQKGSACVSLETELVLGAIMALAIGGGIVYLAFTEVDDEYTGSTSSVNGLFA